MVIKVTIVEEYSCIFKFWQRTFGYIYKYLQLFLVLVNTHHKNILNALYVIKNLYVCDRFLQQIRHILSTLVTMIVIKIYDEME